MSELTRPSGCALVSYQLSHSSASQRGISQSYDQKSVVMRGRFSTKTGRCVDMLCWINILYQDTQKLCEHYLGSPFISWEDFGHFRVIDSFNLLTGFFMFLTFVYKKNVLGKVKRSLSLNVNNAQSEEGMVEVTEMQPMSP